jgi:hypothetical protein
MVSAALIATGSLVALFSAARWLGRTARTLVAARHRKSIQRDLRRAGLLFERGSGLAAYSK